MRFEIIPHIGVGPIKFGMSRKEVEDCFGKPEFDANDRIGFMSGFIVNFDDDDKVEFIEMANSNVFEATYKGINLHSVKADEAISILEKDVAYDKDNLEAGHSYIFKELQLSLWRGSVPVNSNDEEGQYFEAVGVANKNYF